MTDADAVYIVDDDEAVLLSVKAMLSQHGFQSRGYLSANEFLAEAPTDCPGCVITDLQMPEVSGVELQQRLLAAKSYLAVVVVTGVADVPTTVTLMEQGAITLLEKPYDHNKLVLAVERGLSLSREQWLRARSEQSTRLRLLSLTEEESQVMQCMLTGQPNKAIAHRLGLSMRTVDRRRQAVLEKMAVKTAPELGLLLGQIRNSPSDGSWFSRHGARQIVN